MVKTGCDCEDQIALTVVTEYCTWPVASVSTHDSGLRGPAEATAVRSGEGVTRPGEWRAARPAPAEGSAPESHQPRGTRENLF